MEIPWQSEHQPIPELPVFTPWWSQPVSFMLGAGLFTHGSFPSLLAPERCEKSFSSLINPVNWVTNPVQISWRSCSSEELSFCTFLGVGRIWYWGCRRKLSTAATKPFNFEGFRGLQSSAQSKVNFKLRSGCLELYSVEFCVSPSFELHYIAGNKSGCFLQNILFNVFQIMCRLPGPESWRDFVLPTPFNPQCAQTEVRCNIWTEMLGRWAHCRASNIHI